MENVKDDYVIQGFAYETLTERSFSRFFIEPNGGGHYKLVIDSNYKICLLTLAPSHPIITNDLVVSAINYQANDNNNRTNNKISGYSKAEAQFLNDCSIVCSIICEGREEPFIIRSNLSVKWTEKNQDIVKHPNLLKNAEKGYLAILFPDLKEYDRDLRRWLTEEEYVASLLSQSY